VAYRCDGVRVLQLVWSGHTNTATCTALSQELTDPEVVQVARRLLNGCSSPVVRLDGDYPKPRGAIQV